MTRARGNCSRRPGVLPARTTSPPSRRCARPRRFRSSPADLLSKPRKRSRAMEVRTPACPAGPIHRLYRPETRSREVGWPAFSEATEDHGACGNGAALRPPPDRVLGDPAQGPRDRLRERPRRGGLRLSVRLHRGLPPADRDRGRGRRPPLRRPGCGDRPERDPPRDLLRPPRSEGSPPDCLGDPASLRPRVRLHDGPPVARPRGGRRGNRRRRVPVHVERDHRGSDDGRATERRVLAVVHPEQRRGGRGLRSASGVPRPPGRDRDRQPHDPHRRPRRHGRVRVPHADCLLPSPPRLPGVRAASRGAAEDDGLAAPLEVLRHQRAHRPRGRVLHPAHGDVDVAQVRRPGHVERAPPRPRERDDRDCGDWQHAAREAIRSRPRDRHGARPVDRLHAEPRLHDERGPRGRPVPRPRGAHEHVRADRRLLPDGDYRAGAAGARQRRELDHLAPPEQRNDGPRRDPDGRGLLRSPDIPCNGVLRRLDFSLLHGLPERAAEWVTGQGSPLSVELESWLIPIARGLSTVLRTLPGMSDFVSVPLRRSLVAGFVFFAMVMSLGQALAGDSGSSQGGGTVGVTVTNQAPVVTRFDIKDSVTNASLMGSQLDVRTTYWVWVTVFDENNWSDIKQLDVNFWNDGGVNPEKTYYQQIGGANLRINLTYANSGSNAPTTGQWSLGEGNANFTSSSIGIYTITANQRYGFKIPFELRSQIRQANDPVNSGTTGYDDLGSWNAQFVALDNGNNNVTQRANETSGVYYEFGVFKYTAIAFVNPWP